MDTFGSWTRDVAGLAEQFARAQPFPHLVIEDFLAADFAEQLHAEFPQVEAMPKSRDYVFGAKRELSSVEQQGSASRRYHEALVSAEFAEILSELTGRSLFVDPAHHGGGFHQGSDGSYLDTHVDFNVHPLHDDWLRVLNILLYLCKDWKDEYDGALLIRSSPHDEPARIMPGFNQAVIMLTGDGTYHGYKRMSLPPGTTRKSIATYAYEEIAPGSVRARTTGWAPEGNIAKRALAKYYDGLVSRKNRLFGSATARNR